MAAVDILSLEEARRAANVPNPSTASPVDAELQLALTGISRRVDALCGSVVQRTYTGEEYDGGGTRILLDHHYAASVTSIVEYSGTTSATLAEQSNTVHPAAGFRIKRVGPYSWLRRTSGTAAGRFAFGVQNIVVTYVSGRYANTAAVEEHFKTAVGAMLRRAWKREQSAWAQSPGFLENAEDPSTQNMFYRAIDPMLREFLAHELLPPVGL